MNLILKNRLGEDSPQYKDKKRISDIYVNQSDQTYEKDKRHNFNFLPQTHTDGHRRQRKIRIRGLGTTVCWVTQLFGLLRLPRFIGFIGFIADGKKLFLCVLCELCERYSFSLARSLGSLETAETAEKTIIRIRGLNELNKLNNSTNSIRYAQD